MINKITLENFKNQITIESDIAGQNPIYLFYTETEILYTKELKLLLNYINKSLTISDSAISFLLKSGLVPTPYTVYKNVYILSIGNKVIVSNINNKFKIEFLNEFPFQESDASINLPDEDYILDLIANATISKIKPNRNSYLFHSAGKDSNTIALSLSKNNYTDVTFVSHKSKGKSDESEISKKISDKLGFNHKILYEPSILEKKHINAFDNYFKNLLLPVMDVVSLAYPIYDTQINFKDSNIIDGMGNDVYIGHIPSRREYQFANYLSKVSFLKPLTNKLNSENYFHILGLNKIEWTGLVGFMNKDCLSIYPEFDNIDNYWQGLEKDAIKLDYFELRAKIRGGIIDQEIFMRKVRNFADINNANLIFPWADSNVAHYFNTINPKYLYNKKILKNKLILRELLKTKLDLDSDKLGKLGYTFDYWKIMNLMFNNVKDEILNCNLWDKKGIEIIFNRLYKRSIRDDRFSNRAKSLIQRLYLISAWFNNNKYANNR